MAKVQGQMSGEWRVYCR